LSTFKEIKELRTSGKLEEAYQKASDWLESDEDSEWAKRSMGFVLIDFLKIEAKEKNIDAFRDRLQELINIGFSEEDNIILENIAWAVGQLIFKLRKDNGIPNSTYLQIFQDISSITFPAPLKGYSFLFKAFHKVFKETPNYVGFVNWWDISNFSKTDFEKEEYNGKKIMSIGEQAYIAYSKTLLSKLSFTQSATEYNAHIQQVRDFIPKIEQIALSYPELQYPGYYHGKLLLALGATDEALSVFLPFAKKQNKQFWVWDLLGDFFKDDIEKQTACYCQSLLCHSPAEFFVNVREKLTKCLIAQNEYECAKYEIIEVLKLREAQGWKISNKIQDWQKEMWFLNAQSISSNSSFYKQNSRLANSLLYKEIPKKIAVIDYINKPKGIANWLIGKNKKGFFRYKNFIHTLRIGDLVELQLESDSNKILTARISTDINSELKKEFNGFIRLHNSGRFGFVDDIYISNSIRGFKSLKEDDYLVGIAILSFDKKKDRFGWKAIRLDA